jgi:hypothetical protein
LVLLRPLPRAWWRQDGDWLHVDLAFWSGDTVIATRSRDFDTGELPIAFQYFWQGNGAGLMAHADVSNRTVGPRPAFSARDDLATIARA